MLGAHRSEEGMVLTSVFIMGAISLGSAIVSTHRQTIAAFSVPAAAGMISACLWHGGMVGSLLANIGDGAAHALVSGVQNAAAGAAKGFVTGGPGGAAAGAAKGVASAGSNGGVGVANGPMRMPARSTAAARR